MWVAMFLFRALLTSQWLGREHEELASFEITSLDLL